MDRDDDRDRKQVHPTVPPYDGDGVLTTINDARDLADVETWSGTSSA